MTTAEPVTFKSIPATRGWTVVRDEKGVAHYPNQSIAEREMARLARAVANKGGQARAILHKRDGTIAGERAYTQVTAPGARLKVR